MTHTTITSSNSAAVKRVGRCETALISSTGAEEAEALAWPSTVASLFLCGFIVLYFAWQFAGRPGL